jgi:hypothetical protein
MSLVFSRPFITHSSPDPKDKAHLPPPLYPGVHGHGVVLGALAKLNPMAAGEAFVAFSRFFWGRNGFDALFVRSKSRAKPDNRI